MFIQLGTWLYSLTIIASFTWRIPNLLLLLPLSLSLSLSLSIFLSISFSLFSLVHVKDIRKLQRPSKICIQLLEFRAIKLTERCSSKKGREKERKKKRKREKSIDLSLHMHFFPFLEHLMKLNIFKKS